MSALRWLDVYVVGDRLHRKGRQAQEAERRLRKKEPRVQVPDHTRRKLHQPRSTRRTVDPHPNAPLLIRLVKNPERLDITSFRRITLEKVKLEERQRPELFGTAVRQELRKNKQVRKMRPMALHLRPCKIDRPPVEEWCREVRK